MSESKKEEVKDYYGKTLQKSEDLKTNACCTALSYPDHIKSIMGKVHDEVMAKYYGCGLTIPHELEGLTVLDLGSGSGRDCYIVSALVGNNGKVIGVDMTDEQLEVANNHLDYHAKAFGHDKSNVTFLKGDIEKLNLLDLPENSVDVVISNCVINLATDKHAVLKEVFRLLKPGGEMFFSDVYSDRKVPNHLVSDPVLYGECLSGALYWNDFINLSKEVGFRDPRLVESAPITIMNKDVESKVGMIKFYSATYRLFKIESLEPDCEDYGQAVIYKGTLNNNENYFRLDENHIFPKGNVFKVCGNSFKMLKESRFEKHFEFIGDQSTHYGIFQDCGKVLPFDENPEEDDFSNKGSCC
tara:strand:- start:1231 stop:2298 length:1068 start_codon:yes stop_codon:yes gene_type:complete